MIGLKIEIKKEKKEEKFKKREREKGTFHKTAKAPHKDRGLEQ